MRPAHVTFRCFSSLLTFVFLSWTVPSYLLKNNKLGLNAEYYFRVKRFCESGDLLGGNSRQPKSVLEDDRYAGGELRAVESAI